MKETPEQTPIKVGEEVELLPFPSGIAGVQHDENYSQMIGKKLIIVATHRGKAYFKAGCYWPLSKLKFIKKASDEQHWHTINCLRIAVPALTRASEAETVEELEQLIAKEQKPIKPEYYEHEKEYQAELKAVDYYVRSGYGLASAHISALQKEVEGLRTALHNLWKHAPDLEDTPEKDDNDFTRAIKEAYRLTH